MPAEDRKAFLLRIDPKLWADLESWASAELRSINGQIEFILRDAVRQRKGGGSENREAGGEKKTPRRE